KGFFHLKEYSEREGHCRVPKGYRTDIGYPLGNWVATRRLVTKDSARRQRLESLRGWYWDPYSDQWEKGFSYLKEYSEREGHCRVPYSYKTNDGYRLGGWVHNKRANKDKMDLIAKMQTPPDEAGYAERLQTYQQMDAAVEQEASAARKLIASIIED